MHHNERACASVGLEMAPRARARDCENRERISESRMTAPSGDTWRARRHHASSRLDIYSPSANNYILASGYKNSTAASIRATWRPPQLSHQFLITVEAECEARQAPVPRFLSPRAVRQRTPRAGRFEVVERALQSRSAEAPPAVVPRDAAAPGWTSAARAGSGSCSLGPAASGSGRFGRRTARSWAQREHSDRPQPTPESSG